MYLKQYGDAVLCVSCSYEHIDKEKEKQQGVCAYPAGDRISAACSHTAYLFMDKYNDSHTGFLSVQVYISFFHAVACNDI